MLFLLTFAAGAIVVAAVAHGVAYHYGDDVPGRLALAVGGVSIGVLGVGLFAGTQFTMAFDDELGLYVFTLALLMAVPPAMMIAQMLTPPGVAPLLGTIFPDGSPVRRRRDYKTAEAFIHDRRIDEAIAEYRAYFLEDVSDPEPLFAAAVIAEAAQKYCTAEEVYAEIANLFADQTDIWARASLRRANILSNCFGQRDLAASILEGVATFAPNLEEGHAAGRILQRRRRAMQTC